MIAYSLEKNEATCILGLQMVMKPWEIYSLKICSSKKKTKYNLKVVWYLPVAKHLEWFPYVSLLSHFGYAVNGL